MNTLSEYKRMHAHSGASQLQQYIDWIATCHYTMKDGIMSYHNPVPDIPSFDPV